MCQNIVFCIFYTKMRTSDLAIALAVLFDDLTHVLLGSLHKQTECQIVRRICRDGRLRDGMIYGVSDARLTPILACTRLKTATTKTDNCERTTK